ncbi:ThiF family adenylyltransferase [Planococcus alpniumensis]|uniref:ThiF family adenylyltransferase n=1 Tax=Planococcus alpniumensis TaxID=2708345 RepID=UPI001B8B7E7B|nr:ThiF family adenylyltransferase [Planococcus sp. MSAK28401]
MINLLDSAKTDYSTKKGIYPFIVQIGTGGTGGYLVQHIAQLLGTSKRAATYVIADPDVIEEKNLGNQLFLASEVGLKKADVLASRYSYAYNIDIRSKTTGYIESVEDVLELFNTDYLTDISYSDILMPIVIGCVDNNYTRKVIHDFIKENAGIYIDAGNESTVVPADWQTRSKAQWTEDELKAFNESGWSGQIVTGLNLNLAKLPTVADAFPDILETDDQERPSSLSCTELTASEPQRLIVNKFSALAILSVLTEIVEDMTLSSHITFFQAKKGYMRSTEAIKQTKEPHSL